MAARRKSSARPNLNFRPSGPDITRAEARGTRPTAPPTTIKEILVDLVMHLGKKTLFFDTNMKVGLYLGALIIISAIGDTVPLPRSYLARSDNLFNKYFVKIGWGWTLLLVLPYVAMTSYTLCCGNFRKMLQRNLARILIATMMWFFWTKFFNYIEYSYGRCSVKSFGSKSACLKAGHLWRGFDISGHAFILIHSSLVLIEESRPIIKWESIREHLRNEFYNRSSAGRETSTNSEINPLRNLSDNDLRHLKFLYERFTPLIRVLFIAISALQVLWDVMLVCTMLYFHRMAEKFLSGVIAILVWYFTYRFWYPSIVLPDAPGTGNFIYQPKKIEATACPSVRRQPTTQAANDNNIPKFMGMPLYPNSRPPTSATTNGVASSQNLEMSS